MKLFCCQFVKTHAASIQTSLVYNHITYCEDYCELFLIQFASASSSSAGVIGAFQQHVSRPERRDMPVKMFVRFLQRYGPPPLLKMFLKDLTHLGFLNQFKTLFRQSLYCWTLPHWASTTLVHPAASFLSWPIARYCALTSIPCVQFWSVGSKKISPLKLEMHSPSPALLL